LERKIDTIAVFLPVQDDLCASIRSFLKTRDCLTHAQGIIREQELAGSIVFSLSWHRYELSLDPTELTPTFVRREKLFALGERIYLLPAELLEFLEYIRWVGITMFSACQEFAQEHPPKNHPLWPE
jgi:hypothetical protein